MPERFSRAAFLFHQIADFDGDVDHPGIVQVDPAVLQYLLRLVGQLLVDLNPDASDRNVVDRECFFFRCAPANTTDIGLGRWQLQPVSLAPLQTQETAGQRNGENFFAVEFDDSCFLGRKLKAYALDLTTELAAFGL